MSKSYGTAHWSNKAHDSHPPGTTRWTKCLTGVPAVVGQLRCCVGRTKSERTARRKGRFTFLCNPLARTWRQEGVQERATSHRFIHTEYLVQPCVVFISIFVGHRCRAHRSQTRSNTACGSHRAQISYIEMARAEHANLACLNILEVKSTNSAPPVGHAP